MKAYELWGLEGRWKSGNTSMINWWMNIYVYNPSINRAYDTFCVQHEVIKLMS